MHRAVVATRVVVEVVLVVAFGIDKGRGWVLLDRCHNLLAFRSEVLSDETRSRKNCFFKSAELPHLPDGP